MNGVISYWAFFGTMYLIIYTIELFRKKEIVDARKQYFMNGVSVILYSAVHTNLLFVFVILGVTIILNIILNYKKNLFQADVNAISWIFLGISIINMFYLLWFFIILLTLCAFALTIKNIFFRKEQHKIYMFPFILISFIVFCLTLGLY